MLKWFGLSWGAPVNESCEHVENPGGTCMWCHQPIQPGDRGLMIWSSGKVQGLPSHLYCLIGNLAPTTVWVP